MKYKTKKEFEEAFGLISGGAVALQGMDVVKYRTSPGNLAGVASGVMQVGITGAVGRSALKMATGPIAYRKKKKRG